MLHHFLQTAVVVTDMGGMIVFADAVVAAPTGAIVVVVSAG